MSERREAIAALEHEQWLDWIAGVIDHLPEERQRQLRRLAVDYEDLPDSVKEINRYYADRVLAVVDPLIAELVAVLEDLSEGAYFARNDATSAMLARARAALKDARR